ncbi:glycosyltransferase [Xylophilus sp. Kf1]|nr:glycosyltransferase [Xylophilus sp. Kf1]
MGAIHLAESIYPPGFESGIRGGRLSAGAHASFAKRRTDAGGPAAHIPRAGAFGGRRPVSSAGGRPARRRGARSANRRRPGMNHPVGVPAAVTAVARAEAALQTIVQLSTDFRGLVGKLKDNHALRSGLIEQISLAANHLAMEQARSAPILGLLHENPSLFKRSPTSSMDHVWDIRRRWHDALLKLNIQFEIYAELIDAGRESNEAGRAQRQELIERATAAESQATAAQNWLVLAVEALRYARKSSVRRSQLVLPSAAGPPGVAPHPPEPAHLEAMVKVVEASGLFDAEYYLSQWPQVIDPRIDPLRHYLQEGWHTGHDPMPLFSCSYYLRQQGDAQEVIGEPLTHYIRAGLGGGRDPHPLFLAAYYQGQLPRRSLGQKTWLGDFLVRPDAPSPHPLFDVSYYAGQAGWPGHTAAFYLLHYLVVGWRHETPFSPAFNAGFYRSQWPKGIVTTEPYAHYIEYGVACGLDPHPLFDTDFYLQTRTREHLKTDDPLVDFILAGEAAGISPSPFFDLGFYALKYRQRGEWSGSFLHFLTEGGQADQWPRADFPSDRYRQAFMQGLAPAIGHSAIEHFLIQGIPELADESLPPREVFIPETVAEPSVARRRDDPQAPVPSVDAARGEARKYKQYAGKQKFAPGLTNILLVGHAAGEKLFGSERSFLDMVDGLSALPANVYVVLPRNVPDYTNAIRPMVQFVSTFVYGWWRKDQDIEPDAQALFEDLITSLKIDVVHINTIMLRECAAAARKCRVRSVTHVRELITEDQALLDIIGASATDIVASVTQRTDWVIGNSRLTADVFHKTDRTFCIPNTLEIEAFDIANTVTEGRIRFGLISSNIAKKGLQDVVDLATLCAQGGHGAEFHFIGPITPMVEALQARQRSGALPPNLVFPGYAATPVDAIGQVHVLLNFSHFAESFGRTVLEAMAAGRPVIAYEWGALPELVQHGVTGYLVPYRDPAAALPFVESLCRSPDLINRLGEAGRAEVARNYGRAPYRRQLQEAYARMTALPAGLPAATVVKPARLADIRLTDDQPRIAYFCWHFPVPSETFVLNELEALVRAGHDVIVFCRQSPHKHFKPSFPIAFERVGSVEELARRLQQTRRSIVHAHFVYPTVTNMVWPACEMAKIPFTFIAHAQDIFKHENDRLNRLADIGASPWCRKMFTLSQFHMDYVIARGFPARKIVINPNAVHTDRFAAARATHREDRVFRRVLAVHRYVPKKGLALLIEAFSWLKDLSLTVDIYGYGDCEAEYQALKARLGLSNVNINGQIAQDEVVEQMRTADLFVCPSVRTEDGDMDGIPTSIVESMAAGLPVLATDIAGITELVVDGLTGLICEPSVEGVAAAIRRYYDMSAVQVRAIADAAQEKAVRHHDATRSVRVLSRVWENRTTDIVVVAWNNLAELQAVVDRILKNTALPYHLIVCDNHSEREPVPEYLDALWAAEDRVTVIHNATNAMVGPGTNTAMAQGKSDIAIYVCGKEGFSFANGWEIPFIHTMATNPEAGLVGTIGRSPTYLTGDQYPKGISLFGKFRNQAFAQENRDRIFGHVQGGLFGIRRAMVEAIGGFSDEVPHDYTDVEYSYYAESRGWKLAESPQVMALFNKSRPSLSQRFDETVLVAHPCMLGEMETFDQVRKGALRHCNICDWFGAAFGEGIRCVACGSLPADRSLYRWLAESPFMYRRLPSLAVGLEGRIEKTWSEQFQGPRFSMVRFLDEIQRHQRLKNGAHGFHLAVLKWSGEDTAALVPICRELARLMRGDGRVIFQGEQENHDWRKSGQALDAAMAAVGWTLQDDIRYTSRALSYSPVPMRVFQLHGGPSRPASDQRAA